MESNTQIKHVICSNSYNSYSIVVVDGLTIICRQSNLVYNNFYKNYVIITNIVLYYCCGMAQGVIMELKRGKYAYFVIFKKMGEPYHCSN